MLNFQLEKHEEYLRHFILLFKRIDKTTHGVLNNIEIELLMKEMALGIGNSEVSQLVEKINPNNIEKLTFSDCVEFFTLESLNSGKNAESIMDVFNSKKIQ